MKIESHDIRYTTAHEFSYEKIDTFKEELTTLTSKKPIYKEKVEPLSEMDFTRRIKFMLIQELLQVLFGKQKSTLSPQNISQEKFLHVKKNPSQLRVMKTVELEYESTYKEAESLSMQTKGKIQTKDGRSIEVDLDFTMQRSFYSQTTIKESVFIDPLVINIDGNPPSFSDKTISFDIDCDGKSDQISCLAKGNGFLAFDSNENGLIDDGSELFGTSSGNGFKDLKRYDEDGNKWIDENDAIFDGLRIWSDGELIGLGEIGLGAIYLGAHSSPYTYKNDDNESLSRLRQSSIVLFESGKVGTISQVDFVKGRSQEPLSEVLARV